MQNRFTKDKKYIGTFYQGILQAQSAPWWITAAIPSTLEAQTLLYVYRSLV